MAQPQRNSPARKNSGRGSNAEPTSPSNQTPSEIFGASTALGTTGLGGSAGPGAPGDVTQESDQTHERISGANSGTSVLAGSAGAGNGPDGGDSVTYTDPLAWQSTNMGSRNATVSGAVDGNDDWTQGAGKYATGPTLPGIEGNRPTSTGVGPGHVKTRRVG